MVKTPPEIVALSCSPSVGRNSDTMLDYFIRGAKEQAKDQMKIEKIYLKDVHVDHYAYENSEGPEPHEKEFGELCQKIQKASALVIATPTYNFSVPDQLKNFIDRIRFFALDFDSKNKLGQPVGKLKNLRLYFLVSGGTPKWAQKILFFAFPPFWLRGVFLYYGAQCMGAYYSGDVNTFRNKRILAICKKLGEKFAKKVAKKKCKSIFEYIFWRPPQKKQK